MAEPTELFGHTHDIGIRWQNFRGFEDTGWLRLRPLTVLIGPNNSGKSSLLQPLLLLKQSAGSRTGENALLTRGDYLDAGSFRDLVAGHDEALDVEFGIRWHSHPDSPGPDYPPGSLPPGEAAFVFSAGARREDVRLASYQVRDTYRRSMLTRNQLDSGKYSLRVVVPPELKSSGAKEHRAMQAAMRAARPVDFLFTSDSVRQAGIETRPSGENDQSGYAFRIDDSRALTYCQATDYVRWELKQLLDRVLYLGPLREPPRRAYAISGETPPDVGTRGESAPEIIYRWRRNKKLQSRVRHWLKQFDFDEALTWEETGDEAFSLLLQRNGAQATSFLDTGFGMSQVLPLIVQGLKAPKRSWMITEQPEIHLNPRLQATLADLFASFAVEERGVLVETHSEHFLMRLRTLVANGTIPAESVALFFVERHGTQASVREVEIGDTGHISSESWPRGFFEDSLREALSFARAQPGPHK